MKKFFLLNLILVSLLCFATAAFAQISRTPDIQVNILRVAPNDSAEFVPMLVPQGCENSFTAEVLSVKGEWEEVRLSYYCRYNGSTDPKMCVLSLFKETFEGFRKITDNTQN